MSQVLQRMMGDLKLLSQEEQWKLLSYLVDQLQAGASALKHSSSEANRSRQSLSLDTILKEAQGCWGNLSIQEIDDYLERQRQFDWGDRDVRS
jgi:hypothetical protein